MIVAAIASLPVFAWPTGVSLWFWLSILIIAGLIRQFADIEAYKHAEAAVLAPIFYLRLIFISIGGYLLFNEIPRLNTWIGAAIVISATFYMAYRERQFEKQKNTSHD
jgi:drug/metabolite transporter (DMT)-like permease